MNIKDQLKAIPEKLWGKVELPDEITSILKPGVNLTKKPDNHRGSCNCDGRHPFGHCLSGLTAFHQSKGIKMWENRSNDYDICIKCAQASRFIEMILNKEEELILKIIKKVDS